MAVRVHWGDSSPYTEPHGGAWQGGADGRVGVKWGGSAWTNPAYMYVHTSGNWRDSGYRGYPAVPPTSLSVWAWSYSNISLNWAAGAGGAPVAAYHLVQTDAAGNWINQVEVGGAPWGNFGMSYDTRYQFYVRAKSSAGLYSAFAGPFRVGCGHPLQYQYGYVTRTRGWSGTADDGNSGFAWGIRDNLTGINVPGNGQAGTPGSFHIDSVYWYLDANVGVMSPWNNRYINVCVNSVEVLGPMNWQGHPVSGWDYFDYWSNGGVVGFICRGSGWSSSPTGGNPRVWGSHNVYATEYFSNYEIVNTIPEQGNYYW